MLSRLRVRVRVRLLLLLRLRCRRRLLLRLWHDVSLSRTALLVAPLTSSASSLSECSRVPS